MNVIIYGHTMDAALRKLNELYLERERRYNIKIVKKLKNGFDYLLTDDNTLVKVRAFAGDQLDAHKQFNPDIGYVDVKIPVDIRSSYIYPRVFHVLHFLGKDDND